MILLIGDVQGCADALDRLLAACGFSPSRHQLVVLGDMVNRGPDSVGVLQRLRAMGDAAACVLGNHDLHLLAVAAGVRPAHRGDTFDDILSSPQREAWLEWLRHRPLALARGGWLCVHAGIPPAWSAQRTLELAHEVQEVLRSPQSVDFLHLLYGNEPSRWDEQLHGPDRWRYVVNALTRIRFVAEDDRLELITKEGAGAAPAGHLPWFEVPHRLTRDTPVAFGHWSTWGLLQRPGLLGLDTGCVWGGRLTAARVDDGRCELISVPCHAN